MRDLLSPMAKKRIKELRHAIERGDPRQVEQKLRAALPYLRPSDDADISTYNPLYVQACRIIGERVQRIQAESNAGAEVPDTERRVIRPGKRNYNMRLLNRPIHGVLVNFGKHPEKKDATDAEPE